MKAVLAEGLTKPAEIDFTVAYSGGKLMLTDWQYPVVFNLATTTVHDNIPILLNHDPIKRVGSVTSSAVTSDHISLEGIIVRSLPDSKTVLDVHKAGGFWECSVGTGPIENKKIELITNGSLDVNNQNIEAPFYLLNNVEIREISLVSAGADSETQVEIRASLFNNSIGVIIMEFDVNDEGFRAFIDDLGLDWDALDEKNRENLIASYQLKKEEAEKVVEEAVEAECEPEPAEKADEEKPVQASGLTAAKKRIGSLHSVNRPVAHSARPEESKIIEASLLISGGANAAAVEKAGYSQAEINEAVSRDYRDIGLHGLMRRAVKASGLYLPTECTARELVRNYHEAIQASGLSTRDYSPSGIMSNVADKLLRIQADQINNVAPDVFYTRSVKTFNPVTSGKLTPIGTIPAVQRGEDFTNVGIADGSQDYKIEKYGVNLTITIEDQINDDLGAFERALQDCGRKFANTVDSVAIGALMSQANTIFTGSKKKTLAFSAENLKTVLGAFSRIKDAGGEYRNLKPGAILSNWETAYNARALFVFNDKASIAPQDSKEVFATPYNVYGTPYIGENDGWFLLPRDEKIGEVAYLNGNTSPTVEQAALNTKNLNIEFLIWGTCGVLIYNDAPAIYSKPA
ncbi:MAG: HK97 family phage prohead protease [Thermoguttaceae bacterium]|nr:HK97 family phage prohead protease [Thermoguttaceae bacterium]